MSTTVSDQAVDAILFCMKARNGELIKYKELEQIIEENSQREMVVRADVQTAVRELIRKGLPIQVVRGDGYIYRGENNANQS